VSSRVSVFVFVFAVLFVEFLLIKNTSFVDLTLIPASPSYLKNRLLKRSKTSTRSLIQTSQLAGNNSVSKKAQYQQQKTRR